MILLCAGAPAAVAEEPALADPVPFVCDMTNHALGKVCDFYDPRNDVVAFDTCRALLGTPALNNPLDWTTWEFTDGLIGGQYVREIKTICRKGSAVATEVHTGQFGFMTLQLADGPDFESGYPVCSRWEYKFAFGNPKGFDPNTTYSLVPAGGC